MSNLPYGPEPPPQHWPPGRPQAEQAQVPAGPLSGYSLPNLLDGLYANAVYYPDWRIYRGERPSSLNYGVISHVFYAFAWVRPDGTVYLYDTYADTQMVVDGAQGCLGAFSAIKRRYSHLKLLLSIGGAGQGSQSFAAVAANAAARERFGRTARDLVNQFRLDGIDVDWEHPTGSEQGRNYVHLLAAIRRFLPSPTYIVTSALPAGEWALRDIDVARAQQHLDYINLMTYDFSGPWSQTSGHHAQLFTPSHPLNDAARLSCRSAVEYLISRGIRRHKILLGIPVYGRSFLGANAIGQPYNGSAGQDGTFDYKNLPRPGALESVDQQVGAAFSVGGDGGFVSYDNPQTVRMKGNYVRQNRLGGLFYWTGTADARGPRSLVETGYRALHP